MSNLFLALQEVKLKPTQILISLGFYFLYTGRKSVDILMLLPSLKKKKIFFHNGRALTIKSTSLAQLCWLQASNTVEVDPDAMEKLRITRSDFIHALQNDIKPVSRQDGGLLRNHCLIVW